jgi:hypothetical protein
MKFSMLFQSATMPNQRRGHRLLHPASKGRATKNDWFTILANDKFAFNLEESRSHDEMVDNSIGKKR